MNTFLGIDFGFKKIGIAIARGGLIRALAVYRNSSDIFLKIAKVCRENSVKKIIIGLPEGELSSLVKRFSRRLSLETGLTVVFQDETLTSREAVAKMINEGLKRRERKRMKDAFAAACILRDYFLRKEGKDV